jgi:hypothetical protein
MAARHRTMVRAAIADLRARGLKVTLYPFVMMDVPHTNGLTDPYSGDAGQPAYPWRGRITCNPAPGVSGSPDKSAAAEAQVAAFMANGYREMVLHYAQLAQDAGGVDAILVGSEMRGLSWVRSGPASFPFVDALKGLAADMRAIVGAGTKISYGADWTEYFGYQPPDAPGDIIFHLDPLWADANIDAVAIDNYMPLADWRDGRGHADAAEAGSVYDLDYLKANIAGGEGYDWFYASDADRAAQVRTPIEDGAHGEPWVYRYKDLANWWSQPHHNRVGGVRSAVPTAWVPGTKPVWMTEIGCGAVDKGANAPNAFGDPKSAEDKRPYFSSGAPDVLMQRQVLRAIHGYWAHDNLGMVDPDRLYVWCWDARPFPAFPGRSDVWSDAANYPTGHWLNGRLGMASTGEILAAMAVEYDVPLDRIDAAMPMVTGIAVDTVVSMRDAMGAMLDASGMLARDGVNGISFVLPDDRVVTALDDDAMMRADGPVLSRRRGDPSEAVGRLTLGYYDRARDYQVASVTALAPLAERSAAMESGLVLDPSDARMAAEGALGRRARGADTVEARLAPSMLALEAGDLVAFAGAADGPFVLDAVRDGDGRAISAHGLADVAAIAITGQMAPPMPALPVIPAEPLIYTAHLPDGAGGSVLRVGAYARPWPGEVVIEDAVSGGRVARLTRPAALGMLTAPLETASARLWSVGRPAMVRLFDGHLTSVPDATVLSGGNRIAVRGDDGQWEVIGVARADLVAPGLYRLDRLLRGQEGTRPQAVAAGAQVLVLDDRVESVPVPGDSLGTQRQLIAYAGVRDGEGVPLSVALGMDPVLPLTPVHLQLARQSDGAIRVDWIRRGRRDALGWPYGDIPLDHTPERYRIEVRAGGQLLRSVETGAPPWIYAPQMQIEDGDAEGITIGVAQVSGTLGPGHFTSGDI